MRHRSPRVVHDHAFGDVTLMTPKPLEVDSVAKKARREMKQSGLIIEDILADLDQQRARYN